MLVCYQFDNHPHYLARVVFYTTLLSPLFHTGNPRRSGRVFRQTNHK
jgi:hypothetical protein